MSALQHAPGTDQAPSMALRHGTFDSRASAYCGAGGGPSPPHHVKIYEPTFPICNYISEREKFFPASSPGPVAVAKRVPSGSELS